jgi:hypothetical protein
MTTTYPFNPNPACSDPIVDAVNDLNARISTIEAHPWTPALLDRLDECERQVAWLRAADRHLDPATYPTPEPVGLAMGAEVVEERVRDLELALSMIIEKAERNPSASDVLSIARAARLPNAKDQGADK